MSEDTTNPVVEQALKRYRLGIEAVEKQVKRELDDLRCQVPELMWPEDVREQRAGQIVAGVPLPPRPMISIPSLDQPVQLVLNQEKAAHLGVEVHALSEDATDDTAEILQGLYRRIEVDSRANLARSWAYERAVKCGRGAYRILTEYADDGGSAFDQKIVIKRLLYQEAAVFDPFAQEPDWSDGRWAFITSWIPLDRYKQKYPKSKISDFDETELNSLSELAPDWIKGDGEARAVLVAEYFRLEYEKKNRVLLDDGSDAYEDEIPEGRQALKGEDARSRPEDVPKLYWCMINAVEELDSEERDGKYIPVIPVIGRELQPFDQERRWVGIYTNNKGTAQVLNYAASGAVESAALEPKAPFDIDPEEIEGYEAFWQQANIRNFPYLPRKKFKNGQFVPLERIQADSSRMQMNAMLMEAAKAWVHTGTGAFEPTLGQESPNQRSGKAVLALQQQHEQGNSHFLDNLAEISMTYEAKVVLDLIPYVYDRPGRIARVLDLEGNGQTVMLNQPFVMNGKRPVAAPPQMPGQQPQGEPPKHYDLSKGRYGVVVDIGKAYDRRAAEGSDKFAALFQAAPELMHAYLDIYLSFQDFPGAKEAAERAKKMLPPPLQDQDQQQDAKMQLQQAKAQMAQMQQAMKEMQPDLIKAKVTIEKAKIDGQTSVAMQAMKDATSVAVAQINAMTKGVQMATESRNEALALGMSTAADADQSAKQRMHESEMARQEHARQLQLAQQQHEQAMQQAQLGQAHALEQGDQSANATMAAQAQQAALQPPPEAGA